MYFVLPVPECQMGSTWASWSTMFSRSWLVSTQLCHYTVPSRVASTGCRSLRQSSCIKIYQVSTLYQLEEPAGQYLHTSSDPKLGNGPSISTFARLTWSHAPPQHLSPIFSGPQGQTPNQQLLYCSPGPSLVVI